MERVIEVENEDGEMVALPAKWEICGVCDGDGMKSHPAFDNGITSEEWERDWGQEERENYLKGMYDVPCGCKDGKVLVGDIDKMTIEQEVLYEEYLDNQYQAEMERKSEERYGY